MTRFGFVGGRVGEEEEIKREGLKTQSSSSAGVEDEEGVSG